MGGFFRDNFKITHFLVNKRKTRKYFFKIFVIKQMSTNRNLKKNIGPRYKYKVILWPKGQKSITKIPQMMPMIASKILFVCNLFDNIE